MLNWRFKDSGKIYFLKAVLECCGKLDLLALIVYSL